MIVPGKKYEKTEVVNASDDAPSQKSETKFSKKYFGFRFAAILVGLLPFLIFELILSFGGWSAPDGVKDPYVGFTASRPLFVKNTDGNRFEIAEYRKPLFCTDSFATQKSQNEFRIFCIGGSTVQGRPFAIETSFSTWLKESLIAADDSKNWTVVNCGGVSYASYRLAPIVEEVCNNYEPDLIVLYTGHNEFLEDRTYDAVKSNPWVTEVHDRLSRLKTYSYLRSLAVDNSTEPNPSNTLTEEVEARLDFKGGLEKYSRDDSWKSGVVNHFAHNLRRMMNAAQTAGVPIVLCNPVANLRDASPFKSENQTGLSKMELEKFEKEWSLIESGKVDEHKELEILQKMVKLHPRHAGLQYRVGQRYQLAGDFTKAKQHLVQAKDQDICPLRIVEPMYKVIEDVRAEFDPIFVDVKSKFEQHAKDQIPGRELLVDHVHPSIRGHQLIAEFIFDEMVARQVIEPVENFEALKSERIQAHLSSLPHLYFQLGKDRLAGLKRWAEGKVTKEK